jgi:HEAT repeat protein
VVCKCCGMEAPTKYVEFYQTIGALVVRYHKQVKGNLCKSCINKYFWRFTLINLTLGWWGIISFVLTPFLILNNLIYYLGTLKLKSLAVNAQIGNKRKTNSIGESQSSEFSQSSNLNPDSSKSSVRERDRVWFSTKDDRPNLPQELEPSGDSSIEELIKYLGHGNNSEFRYRAAELLGQRGSTAIPAISALLIACVDMDATVRKVALNALESIDPGWHQNSEVQKAFPKLTEEFKHSYCFKKAYSEDVSKAAYKLLQQIGKPAVSSLANLIVEEEDKIEYKIRAIWLLKDIGSDARDAVPRLIQSLSSKASQVRIAAADALVNFGTVAKDAIPKLIIGLADRDEDVRKAMMACLIATEPTVPDLLSLLADKNPNVREVVPDILIQIGPKTIPALVEAISQWCTEPKASIDNVEQYQKITEVALHVIEKFGSDASVAVPTIALALVDSNPNIKFAAVRAMGSIVPNWVSDPAVVKAIISFTSAEAAIPEFIAGLAEQNDDVRKAMVACLVETESAVPDLLSLLADKNPNVREAVTNALMQIGPRALPALTGIVSRWCTKSNTDIDNVEHYQKITEGKDSGGWSLTETEEGLM